MLGAMQILKIPKAWSPEMAAEVLLMHDHGERLKDICARFGLLHSQVQQFLNANGRTPHPRSILRGKRLEEARRLYQDERLSAQKVATSLKVSDSTVRAALKKAGVLFRPRHKLTVNQRKRACEMYESKIPYARIAEHFKCSPEVIRKLLHENRIKIRPARKLDPRSLEQILAMYRSRMKPSEIGEEFGVTKQTVASYLRFHGEPIRGPRDAHRKHGLDKAAFTQDSEESEYWIGFLMADCSVRNQEGTLAVALQIGDIGHLRKLKKFLKSTAPIITGKLNRGAYKPGAEFAKLVVHSKDLVDSLIKAGVVPNKTGKEKFVKHRLSRHAWRGAIDGDGSVGRHKRGYFYLKLYGCRQFCEQFRQYVLTIVPSCRAQVQPSRSIFAFGMCCGPAEAVARELYRDCKVYLDRKFDEVKPLFEKTP